MIIREYLPRDKEIVDKIYNDFYKDSNEEVNFGNFLSAFTMIENDKIISVGGVRPILEIVARTDKLAYTRERREALYKLLQAAQFTAKGLGHEDLHCWASDPCWIEQLKRVGFYEERNKSLILSLR